MPEIILRVCEGLGLVMLLCASKTGLKGTYYCATTGSEWEFEERAEVGHQSKEVT